MAAKRPTWIGSIIVNFIRNSLHFRKKEEAWQKKYNPLAPVVGELAPDFELRDVMGESAVRLSDFCGKKPVALVFGSFT